jgi:hypothetical protein
VAKADEKPTPETASAVLYELEDVWINAFSVVPQTLYHVEGLKNLLARADAPVANEACGDATELKKLKDKLKKLNEQIATGKVFTPFADLLRDYSTPIPPGIRDLLAELLNPGDPDICGGRLMYEPTDGLKRAVDEWLPLTVAYHTEVDRRKKAGKKDPSQEAAKTVGRKKIKQSDRTVYRKVKAWRKLVARLRGA